MIDINELRRLAQAATPGPWWVNRDGLNHGFARGVMEINANDWHAFAGTWAVNGEKHSDEGVANAEFIAAANPATINELLDRLEAAEKERDDVAQQLVQSEIGKRKISEAHDAVTRRLSVLADENTSLRAKIADMGQPGAEWFDWLPQGTTHISSIRTVTIPCFGLEARLNAFKYIDGVLYTYRTDIDNEYGEWVKAASRYRNDVLPTVYPLSGAKGEEK